MEFTGERFVPEMHGNIELEHLHRYLLACKAVAGKTVLDIASGEGYGSAILARTAHKVIGVDISKEAISHAQAKYKAKNLKFRVGSCSAIPLKDASVDVVVSFETIEHHGEHEAMMKEIKRILRPGGVLVISSPDKLEYSDNPGYSNPYHVKELYRGDFKKLLSSYFKNHSIYGQRVVYGSVIFCEDGTRPIESYELADDTLAATPGVAHAVYLVAIASDAKLPSLGSGILEQSINKTDLVQGLAGTVAEREGQITSLNRTVADRDALIVNLGQTCESLVVDRDSQKTGLQQQQESLEKIAHERDEQVSQLNRTVTERDTQIHHLNQSLAARDEQITILNKTVTERDRKLSTLDQAVTERDTQIHHLNQSLAARDEQITSLNQAMVERDRQIKSLGDVVMECDSQIQNLSRTVTERDEHINRILNSKSWIFTKPLRFIRRWLVTHPFNFLYNNISKLTHWLLTSAPLPISTRRKLKDGLFKGLPFIFKRSDTYKKWRALYAPLSDKSILLNREIQKSDGRSDYVPLLTGKPLLWKPAKLVCFYLPQFHVIPENNAWWGEGFTEWTNVKSANPKFVGHIQPNIPGELGYYDLLDSAVQRRQIELARLYGIEGFCFYFYWFGGKRLLEVPIQNYLNDSSLDLPFALCWANENWSRRWDGLDSEILIAQKHSSEDDLAFIEYISMYFRDPRYIRIDGKPLLLVYRPNLLPSAKKTAERWRGWCRRNGVGEIYLAYTQSFEVTDPADYGFDAAIEFAPNNSVPPNITGDVEPLSVDFKCTVYDWRIFVQRSENYSHPDYKLFRSISPRWDNTARSKNRGTVFLHSTPAYYQRWLDNAISDTRLNFTNPDERLIFINAWNEWGEGCYLEPDEHYGYAYLQATREALDNAAQSHGKSVLLVTHDCHPHGAQFLSLEMARQLNRHGFRVAILALDGGKLYKDFNEIGRTLNAKEAGERATRDFLSKLRAEDTLDAITSTVVSGQIVVQLKDLGFRVISLVHELPGVIRDMKQEANAKAIAKFSDKVVFPAELVQRRYCEIAPVNSKNVVICPQGVLRKNPYKNRRTEAHTLVCEKHGLPLHTQIVLSIAYVDARKGPDLFVEIAAQVISKRSNTTFIWIGHADPSMKEKVDARIRELGIENKVLFIGFDRQPLIYYAAASVYALTSREDPFPNVVLESAEVDVPVVAFRGTTGAGDFILEHGGYMAANMDIGDFARGVCELLARPLADPQSSVGSMHAYTLDLLHHLNGFPRISVVVPNYNYQQHITERLDSIYKQSFPIYEVIVLDDASDDGSVETIKNYLEHTGNEARLVINDENTGSAFRQWQEGLDLCKGDLVWIAEADDHADCHFLSELCDAFQDPNLVLAFSQSNQIDEHGNLLSDNYLDYTKDVSDCWLADYVHDGCREIGEFLSIKNTIPNVSSVLFRRQALENAISTIGDSLYNYRVAGDWLIYLHVLLQGKVYYNKASLNYHRRHTSSVTSSIQNLRHLKEVYKLQAIARSLVTPSKEALARADRYIEHLHGHFGLSRRETRRELRDAAKQAV